MAISLGNIEFGLGADTAALTKSMDKLVQFGQTVDTISRRQSAGAEQVAAAYRKQEAAVTSALQKTLNFNNAVRTAGAPSTLVDQTAAALLRYTTRMTSGQQSALQMQRANTALNASFGTVTRSLGAFKTTQAAAESNKLVSILRNLASTSTLALGPLGGIASKIGSFASVVDKTSTSMAVFAVGAGAGVLAAIELGEGMITASVKMTQLRMGLIAVTGSSALAAQALQHVVEIARNSGQDLSETAIAYTKFMASANETSLSGQKAETVFNDITMAIGRLHLSATNAQGVFNALDQMMAKGTVTAGPLRQLMRNGLPDAYGLMAQAADMTTSKMMAQISQGKLLSDQVLPKLAEAITKTFHIDNQPIDTYMASLNNLHTAGTQFLDALDQQVGLTDTLKDAYTSLASILDQLRGNMGNLKAVIGAVAGAFVALRIGAITTAFTGLVATIAEAVEVFGALDAAIYLNPFTDLAAILVKIGTAAVGAAVGWNVLKNSMGDTALNTGKERDELDSLTKSLYAAAGGEAYLGDQAKLALEARQSFTKAAIDDLQDKLDKPISGGGDVLFGGASQTNTQSEEQHAKDLAQLKTLQSQMRSNQATLDSYNKAVDDNESRRADPATSDKDPTAKQLQESADALARFNNQYNTYVNETAALQNGGADELDRVKLLDEENKKMQEYKQTLEKTTLSQDDQKEKLEQMNEVMTKHDTLLITAKKDQEAMKDLNNALGSAFDSVGKAMIDMAFNGKDAMQQLSDAFKKAAEDILQELIKLAVLNPLKNGLFGLTGNQALPTLGGGSSGGGIFGSLFGGGSSGANDSSFIDEMSDDELLAAVPGLATGGPTTPGRMYMVGENGPELWSDNSAGNVTNTGNLKQMLSGDSGNNADNIGSPTINLNVTTGVQQTVRSEMTQMMPMIQKQLMGAMVDARRRGGSFANTFRQG